MSESDWVKELWSLGNIITGFSVVQSLGFAVALGKDLAELQTQTKPFKTVLAIIALSFGALYSYGVYRCFFLALGIDGSLGDMRKEVMHGQMACIWLFTLIAIFGLFAPDIFKKHVPKTRR